MQRLLGNKKLRLTRFGAYCFEVFDYFVDATTLEEESGTLSEPAYKGQIYGIGDARIYFLRLRSLIPSRLG